MKLSKEQIDVLKGELKELGWKDENNPAFEYYITKKHITRYFSVIKWMRSQELELTESMVNHAYRIDVVIRGMLSDILKPVELEIASHICYFIKFNNITMGSMLKLEKYEDFKDTPFSVAVKRANTIGFVNKNIKILNRKNNANKDLNKIVSGMTFGQLASLITILDPEIVKTIFPKFENKIDVIKIVEKIVSLRNHIAHHNMILTVEKIKLNDHKSLGILEMIDSISKIASGNYKEDLKTKFKRYSDNTVNKYKSEDENREALLKKLFDRVSSKLFGV